ncbi:hypothetical protein DRN73_02225 [Candidatus Pacearchaeota archaeon]|nr:MAG: hypothetical protein DRN73_02225 [Candidatus Pacearchaeota archaeon]
MKIVLFDIDNTLLKSTKSHQLSFAKALESIFKIPFTLEDINKGNKPGTTDPEIIINALRRKNIPEEEIKEKLPLCYKKTIEFFSKLIKDEGLIILPGVKEFLESLKNENIKLGLVTGNLEPIAWLKMEITKLKPFFSFGAFGTDHPKREILVSLAIEKAKNLFKTNIDLENVYLVGDTVRDVLSGKKAGVKTIAVATGNVSKEELEEAKADIVVETLEEYPKIIEFIKQI